VLMLVMRVEFWPACGSRDIEPKQRDASEIRVEFVHVFEDFTQIKCASCKSLWWERG